MASRGLNKVMLIGNLGKDAETRYTPSGTAVTSFSLATSRRTKDQQSGEWRDQTDWHDIVLWRSENLANYLQKGTKIYVEGRLQTRSWEDQNGNRRYRTEVVADANGVLLLGGRGGADVDAPPDDSSEEATPRRAAATAGSTPDNSADQGITDDDVPF